MHPSAPRALAHLPFYEALASLPESSEQWMESSAGLLALRLVDRWADEEAAGRVLSRWEISGVAAAIDALPATTATRSILSSIVSAAYARQSSSVVLPMLAAYARALHFEAKWWLAADVHETVAVTGQEVDADLAITSAYQAAFCLRQAGDLDRAIAVCDIGRAIAARTHDLHGMLQGDLSVAAVSMQRGNLPVAEAELDSVIERAQGAGPSCTTVLYRSLHNRGTVALRRGRPHEALRYLNQGLRICPSAADRDRLLGDVGAVLQRIGVYESARDAHLILYATAQYQETRWVAGLNLLEISVKTSNEPAFEAYRRDLAEADLPPRLRAHFQMYVADGHDRFGRPEQAIAELKRTIAFCEAHGVVEVLFDAERRLTAPRQLVATVAAPAAAPESSEVWEAERTIRQIRDGELALA